MSAGADGDPGPVGGARERILGRVRTALEGRAPLAHPGPLERGAAAAGELGEAFARSFAAAGGETVLLEGAEHARAWLAQFAAAFDSMAASPDVPPGLRPDLPQVEPSSAALGVSLAVGAAAATGSLLLSSRHGRALQLLPPTHLVWVELRSISSGLEEALARARAHGQLPATLALHSGPSKSADIGRIMVRGVHGPGRVVAALLPGPGGAG